ncbi:MAG TPA: ABC transporter ATP-binding protein, partial [Verrucomicrobiae bacterium]|nr:ABC transporter ATP-binding protein [Verrucomicrobiae bacterium]
ALTCGALLALGARAVLSGAISIGDFVLINAYVLQLVRPVEMLGFALRDIAQGRQFLARWSEILAEPAEPADMKPGGVDRLAPSIAFNDVSFAYGPGVAALESVSFRVGAGEVVALVGPSGAGKSSLLRLLLRYFEPSAGQILVDGAPIDALELQAWRGAVASVGQDTILFNDTLEANIRFARPDADAKAFDRAVSLSRLNELIARLPDGLLTMVGERGLKLSGGERQRVAIARALLKEAPVLVLDEATSALDAGVEAEISEVLLDAARGRTTIIVTHRLALARAAQRIVVLENGRVVEDGAHAALVQAGGTYARLWAAQSGKPTPSASMNAI